MTELRTTGLNFFNVMPPLSFLFAGLEWPKYTKKSSTVPSQSDTIKVSCAFVSRRWEYFLYCCDRNKRDGTCNADYRHHGIRNKRGIWAEVFLSRFRSHWHGSNTFCHVHQTSPNNKRKRTGSKIRKTRKGCSMVHFKRNNIDHLEGISAA